MCSLLKENSCSAIWKSSLCENQRPIMPKPAKSSAQGSTATPHLKNQLQAVRKSYQSQIKNLTQKSHSSHIDSPNQFQACLCHTLKAPRWTGPLMMVFIIDFCSGTLSVRISWNVSMQHYQSTSNARKSLHGQEILAWTSMCPGACHQMS